jgi:ribosomal protein S18 acetylase RimI-like enzyme
MGELRYTTLLPEHASACADLERRAFPTAEPADLLGEDDVLAYASTFPGGFFVCLDDDLVVGQGAGIIVDFDFDHPQHTIAELTGTHFCGNHDPDADWYYGTDIAVDPAYRRRGIGRRLYDLRKETVRRLGLRGIIAGGHPDGYEQYRGVMTVPEYIAAVADGTLYDATLSFQMHQGFEIAGILEGYLSDPSTDDYAALIVWRNPDVA